MHQQRPKQQRHHTWKEDARADELAVVTLRRPDADAASLVGLAISGGGIRSATFNLGLLQAFAQLGVLRQVNYLSTVSGGGYVGGFWTAWLRRRGNRAGEERFPRLAEDLDGIHELVGQAEDAF